MKTGRRIADPSAKKLAGTYRKDRHSDIVQMATPTAQPPVAPAYLTPEGRVVWDEEIGYIIATGNVAADTSFIARYVEMVALSRMAFAEGTIPVMSLQTELRRSAELLGIAGVKSRLTKVQIVDEKSVSKFSKRPK